MKEQHLSARTEQADECAEDDRAPVMLELPAEAREGIERRSDHRQRPHHVNEGLRKPVLGRTTGERTPNSPQSRRQKRENESDVVTCGPGRCQGGPGGGGRAVEERGTTHSRISCLFERNRKPNEPFDFSICFLDYFEHFRICQ